MIRYVAYSLYADLTRGVTLFWSLFFVMFWLAMGAYVFPGDRLVWAPHVVKLGYTASWMALASLISFSAAAISLAYKRLYASAAVPYVVRYTRLSEGKLVAGDVAVAAAFMAVLAVALTAFAYVAFSHSLRADLPPRAPAILVGVALWSGVFFYLFTAVLANLALTVRSSLTRSVTFISFAPLILAYAFGFGQTFADVGWAVAHLSPFNNIMNLMYHAYAGGPVPMTYVMPGRETVDLALSVASLAAWTLAMAAMAAYTSRKVRYVRIEELVR